MSDLRFRSQAPSAEDLLKAQAAGLVELDEYRKRRAEAFEQAEKELASSQDVSRDGTPRERSSTPQPQVKKKRKIGKGKLSFAADDEEGGQEPPARQGKTADKAKANETIAQDIEASKEVSEPAASPVVKRRLGPNTSISNAPKILTKSAMLKEAQAREELRKEFVTMQEVVKGTDIVIPFVFYDGTHVPGGSCRVKKGDFIWLFLDRCRKLGAELAVGGSGEAKNRREWARVGVDDLMLVRGDIIIPHHYEFYYFIVNKALGHDSRPIFSYSTEPRKGGKLSDSGGLVTSVPTNELEGANDDPNLTKVVNRQWYERNKHIFPASMWEEFDPGKDYTKSLRRDAQGNTFFFSR